MGSCSGPWSFKKVRQKTAEKFFGVKTFRTKCLDIQTAEVYDCNAMIVDTLIKESLTAADEENLGPLR